MKTTDSKTYISDTLLVRTADLLASFAKPDRSEGIVYWFGFSHELRSVVTTLIVPNAESNGGCISTSSRANAEAVMSVFGTPLVLIGQAHSHPGMEVGHSDVDDRQTFPRFEGAISVVVPHFAKKGIQLEACGVHRFIEGKYRVLKEKDVSDHLVVVPGERDFRRQRAAYK
jgi:hypothetical protein